jgi:hypothetical protein
VEDEEVVERQHPLKHVAARPHERVSFRVIIIDPAAEATCHEYPEQREEAGAEHGYRVRIAVEDDIVEDDEEGEDDCERRPSLPVLGPEQRDTVVLFEHDVRRVAHFILP